MGVPIVRIPFPAGALIERLEPAGIIIHHLVDTLREILRIVLRVINRIWRWMSEDPEKFLLTVANLAIILS
jgi:hypothetical protein